MRAEIKLTAHQVDFIVFVTACFGISWLALTGLLFTSWWTLALFFALAALAFLSNPVASRSRNTETLGITECTIKKNPQREAYEAFVRSGASPVPPSEVEKPLADGSYRTSAANAGWVFWQAAQAALQQQHSAPAA
jgi:hypothetical protein